MKRSMRRSSAYRYIGADSFRAFRDVFAGFFRHIDARRHDAVLLRQLYSAMRVIGEDQVDKVRAMKDNYKWMKLDCLVTLGGNGTHKTAKLFRRRGHEHHWPAQDH